MLQKINKKSENSIKKKIAVRSTGTLTKDEIQSFNSVCVEKKKKKIKLSVEKLFTSVKIITTIGKMTVD